MDTSVTFQCTVMHPRLFPALPTDPGNPLRVKQLVEVSAEELIIRVPVSRAKGKITWTEPLAEIGRVTIEHLNGRAQRVEVMRRSLKRMALVGGIVLAFALFVRAYPPDIGLLMGLAVAVFIGPINFLFNGGLGRKREVVRFHFFPTGDGQPFYLEVPPTGERELHQALFAAGLRLEDAEAGQGSGICGDCAATVDVPGAGCPQCGAEAED